MRVIYIAEFYTRDAQNRETDRWAEFAGSNFENVCDEAANVLFHKYGSDIETLSYNPWPKERINANAIYRCLDVNPESNERMYAAVYAVQMI